MNADDKADEEFRRLEGNRGPEPRPEPPPLPPSRHELETLLAVVSPSKNTVLMELGRDLMRWQEEVPQAGRIYGLADLMEGRRPKTPAGVIPFIPRWSRVGDGPWPDDSEPIATICVAADADVETTVQELMARLRKHEVWITHPDDYSRMMR